MSVRRQRYTVARVDDVAADELMAKPWAAGMQAALIYTPDRCLIARVVGSAFVVLGADAPGRLDDLRCAYEIRSFGPAAEVRWTRNGATGEATLFADGDIAVADTAERATGTALDVLRRTYLLWGKAGKARADGWTVLAAGRIGEIRVPVAAEQHAEVAIEADEYVVRGEHGNAVVLFERLVGFATAEPKRPEGEA